MNPQTSPDGGGSGDHPTRLRQSFARLRQDILDYLNRRVRDPALAEDLVQDVFLKALSGRNVENLRGWLYAVARTTIADHFRANRHTEPLADEPPFEVEDEAIEHQTLALCLKPMVEALPPIYRDTLLATDFSGQTMREVAADQEVSVSAIKSRAARGRAMLRQQLLECCHIELSNGLVSDYHRRSPATDSAS